MPSTVYQVHKALKGIGSNVVPLLCRVSKLTLTCVSVCVHDLHYVSKEEEFVKGECKVKLICPVLSSQAY